MKRIGLLSDTHGFFDPAIYKYFESCDEIWHAGDIGTIAVAEQCELFKPFRAVYGNIDGADLRIRYPEKLRFRYEGLDVLMVHIGGYPGRYTHTVRHELSIKPPGLFISGHSHILKVIPDHANKLLHINPGAAGNHGIHKVKTLVRFSIEQGRVHELEVIEIGNRGRIL